MLEHHADFIVTRWKKKSKAKRTEFLSTISPEESSSNPLEYEYSVDSVKLYCEKWAHVHLINARSIDAFGDLDPKQIFKGTEIGNNPTALALLPLVTSVLEHVGLELQTVKYRTTWLLPYLDIESLAEEPLLLLSLLHHRTAYTPVCYLRTVIQPFTNVSQEEWMMFDNTQLRLSEHWEVLINEFNEHCVTMRGPKYGSELVEWDKDLCHHWDIVGYQKAQYILSAQQQMMHFLRVTVEGLPGEVARA